MTTPHPAAPDPSSGGDFKRSTSSFRNTIAPNSPFPPEKGRYVLYANLGCPWAGRTLIVRELKGLQDFVELSILDWELGPNGWTFDKRVPEATGDPVYDAKLLKEIYLKADPEYSGRYTVPLLFDRKSEKIVNNESAEIIRIFNSAFNEQLPAGTINLVPDNLKQEIDNLNEWVYDSVNNGVYKTGFATSQDAHAQAVRELFAGLERVEQLLAAHNFSTGSGAKYLVGNILTEADVRLYTTIARFDVAYHGAFHCNLGMIRHDFRYIHNWYMHLYWDYPIFKKYTNFDQIKKAYYLAIAKRTGANYVIVPVGPEPDIPDAPRLVYLK